MAGQQFRIVATRGERCRRLCTTDQTHRVQVLAAFRAAMPRWDIQGVPITDSGR